MQICESVIMCHFCASSAAIHGAQIKYNFIVSFPTVL